MLIAISNKNEFATMIAEALRSLRANRPAEMQKNLVSAKKSMNFLIEDENNCVDLNDEFDAQQAYQQDFMQSIKLEQKLHHKGFKCTDEILNAN